MTAWRTLASCRGFDSAIWFPFGTCPGDDDRLDPGKAARAMAICAECLVTSSCLTEALALPAVQDFGIRAGTTPKERAAFRDRNPRPRRVRRLRQRRRFATREEAT